MSVIELMVSEGKTVKVVSSLVVEVIGPVESVVEDVLPEPPSDEDTSSLVVAVEEASSEDTTSEVVLESSVSVEDAPPEDTVSEVVLESSVPSVGAPVGAVELDVTVELLDAAPEEEERVLMLAD